MPYARHATWDAYDFLIDAHGYGFAFDKDYVSMEISGPVNGIKNVEIILI